MATDAEFQQLLQSLRGAPEEEAPARSGSFTELLESGPSKEPVKEDTGMTFKEKIARAREIKQFKGETQEVMEQATSFAIPPEVKAESLGFGRKLVEMDPLRDVLDPVAGFVGTKQAAEEFGAFIGGQEVDVKRGAGGAASAALMFFPPALAGKGAALLTKVPALGRLISFASKPGVVPSLTRATGFGAAVGAAESAKEDRDIVEGAKTGAVAGPLVRGGISILGLPFRAIPHSITNRLLRLPKSVLKEAKKRGQETVSDKFLAQRRIGSYDDLYDDSAQAVKSLGKKVAAELGDAKGSTKVASHLSNVAQGEAAINAQLSSDDILNLVIRKVPKAKRLATKKSLTAVDANKLRQFVDETIGDRNWLAQNPDKLDVEILKEFANSLRAEVKTLAPKTVSLFDDLSDEIQIRDALLDRLAQGERGTLTLSGLFQTGLGAGVGAAFGPAGAVAGAAMGELAQTTTGRTAAAVIMNELNKAGAKLDRPAFMAIIKALDELFQEEGGDNSE